MIQTAKGGDIASGRPVRQPPQVASEGSSPAEREVARTGHHHRTRKGSNHEIIITSPVPRVSGSAVVATNLKDVKPQVVKFELVSSGHFIVSHGERRGPYNLIFDTAASLDHHAEDRWVAERPGCEGQADHPALRHDGV